MLFPLRHVDLNEIAGLHFNRLHDITLQKTEIFLNVNVSTQLISSLLRQAI
jgi:hypothetical protein